MHKVYAEQNTMSIPGKQVYQQLQAALTQANSRAEQLQTQTLTQHTQLDECRAKLARVYQKLAGFYLDEATAAGFTSRVTNLDARVKELVRTRETAWQKARNERAAKHQQLSEISRQRDASAEQRDNAAATLESQLEQSRAQLLAEPAFKELRDTWHSLGDKKQRVLERLKEAETDRDKKRAPYEKDPIFTYLQEKKFATKDYRGRGLSRFFDSKVANFIHYDDAIKNYRLLIAIPARLAEHVHSLEQEIIRTGKQLDEQHESQFLRDGGGDLRARLQQAEQNLQSTVEQKATAQHRLTELAAELAAFSLGDDPLSQQISKVQIEVLSSDPLPQLQQRASQTPSPSDDALVTQVEQLRAEQLQLERDWAASKQSLKKAQQAQQAIQQLNYAAEQQDWESNYSSFSRDLHLEALLNKLEAGNIDHQQAIAELEQQQKFRYPKPRNRGNIRYRHQPRVDVNEVLNQVIKGGWGNSSSGPNPFSYGSGRTPRGGGFGRSGGFGGGFGGRIGTGGGGFETGGGF